MAKRVRTFAIAAVAVTTQGDSTGPFVRSVLIDPIPADNDVNSAGVASKLLARVHALPRVESCMASSSRLPSGPMTTASAVTHPRISRGRYPRVCLRSGGRCDYERAAVVIVERGAE
jgi:hypothetical protein